MRAEVLWLLFGIAINILEGLTVSRFVFEFQHIERKHGGRIKYILVSLGYAFIVSIVNYFTDFESLLGLIYSLYYFIVTLFLSKERISSKIFTVILANVVILFVNVVIFNIISMSFYGDTGTAFLQKQYASALFVLMDQAILFFVFDIIIKLSDKSIVMNKREWLLSLFFFGFAFLGVVIIHTSILNYLNKRILSVFLLIAELFLIAMTIVCFYMIMSLSKARKRSEEFKLIAQQQDFQRQFMETTKKQYDKMRNIRHDLKQTYAVILSFLQNDQPEKAVEYIKQMNSNITVGDLIIDTGNDFVNAILNSKLNQIQNLEIEVTNRIDKNLSDIEPTDICSLLGNMLDNAIEACAKEEKGHRSISIVINSYQYQHLISVSNTVSCQVLRSGKMPKTTKKDKSTHGLGLKSIDMIAKKYDGNVRYYQEGDIFTCEVVLTK